jgi:glutathione transport system substrate-binding protein
MKALRFRSRHLVAKASLKAAEKPTQFPPGTGPYVMEEWKPGREIKLRKFPYYWRQGLPHIATLFLHPILDDEVRHASFDS